MPSRKPTTTARTPPGWQPGTRVLPKNPERTKDARKRKCLRRPSGRLHQIPNAPECSLYASRHCRSASQGVVPLDEVVIGEVESDRSREVLPFLAESQRKPSETAHVQPSGSVQPLDVAGRNQVKIRTT